MQLLEAQNSIFSFDVISICETSLNDSVKLPDTLLDNYTLVHCNNPSNTKHGSVSMFYKNTLPVKVRNDLEEEEEDVLVSGTSHSLDSYCHHHMTYCTSKFSIPPPHPCERRIWHYDRANSNLIKRAIFDFDWESHLNSNLDPNRQFNSFNE